MFPFRPFRSYDLPTKNVLFKKVSNYNFCDIISYLLLRFFYFRKSLAYKLMLAE